MGPGWISGVHQYLLEEMRFVSRGIRAVNVKIGKTASNQVHQSSNRNAPVFFLMRISAETQSNHTEWLERFYLYPVQ